MHMVEKKGYKFCLENLNRKNHLGDLGDKIKVSVKRNRLGGLDCFFF